MLGITGNGSGTMVSVIIAGLTSNLLIMLFSIG